MTATATPPEPTDQAPADALPIDVVTIRATITRALRDGPAPAHDDLVLLEQLLRGHIQLLLPEGERAVEQLKPGKVDYVGQRQVLNVARDRVQKGLPSNPATAHTHVRLLAHDCRALLRYAEEAGR